MRELSIIIFVVFCAIFILNRWKKTSCVAYDARVENIVKKT